MFAGVRSVSRRVVSFRVRLTSFWFVLRDVVPYRVVSCLTVLYCVVCFRFERYR